MLGFIFGVLVGFGAKMAYDFFQEERIPTDLGMAQGRAEAIMDETRQIVREMREELRSFAASAQSSVTEKASRLQAAATRGSAPPGETEGNDAGEAATSASGGGAPGRRSSRASGSTGTSESTEMDSVP